MEPKAISGSNEAQAGLASTPQDWLLSACQLWGLTLLTLHLAAPHLPEATTWSLWPYTFFPPWLGWTLALLVGALIIPAINQIALTGLRFTIYDLRFTIYASHLVYPHLTRQWFSLLAGPAAPFALGRLLFADQSAVHARFGTAGYL